MSGMMEKVKETLGMGHHSSSNSSTSTSSSSSMSSNSSSVMPSSTAGVSYNAEGGMLNQSGSGFGASAANFGAPGATVDPTMGTTYGSGSNYGSSSAYSSSSLSSSSNSNLGSTHTHGHHHHHHHHGSSSAMSSSAYGYGSSSSLSSTSSSAYGNTTADNAMTRSEEQLLVGKERVEVGEAALRKTITSEHVETSIPLIREKVVLEREPITEANRSAAYSGAELKEAEYVVKTAEERPIVEKEVVAKERVRLGKVAEVTNQTVGGEIRKEHIEFVQGGAPLAGGIDATTGTATNSSLYNKDTTGYGNTRSSDLRKEANY